MKNVAFLFFWWYSVKADFESNLKMVVLTHQCDPECTFNYSEITSKTVQFLPNGDNCVFVCGIMTFNANTDLSVAQLTKAFETISVFYGGIVFDNTNFTNITFFPKSEWSDQFEFCCYTFGLTVVNNLHLTDFKFFRDIFYLTDRHTSTCPFLFENNPKLDTGKLCKVKDMSGIKSIGNLKDCGCPGNGITSANIETLRNCSVLYDFNLSNESDDLTALAEITAVTGEHNIKIKSYYCCAW
ncbi:Receptor L-domain domain-containing protein [Caenorhabditis elegans]|uniref:Receptor L-domain domain-containing protein n=1 Tax=Caenorhabditis elegans TaxID=6239 RepID=A0A061AJI1_CAEEL|nr:Receptor L-domain domain-containing protein [Caenorhabditis elegans]CDR32781.1 Receptor L-domain domain-containing protein [Caenorhabditis elegans]|eukprot:NP_001293998.1 Insulin/EGF-Receptor L Domain protein [Caenorhabditis elegans]